MISRLSAEHTFIGTSTISFHQEQMASTSTSSIPLAGNQVEDLPGDQAEGWREKCECTKFCLPGDQEEELREKHGCTASCLPGDLEASCLPGDLLEERRGKRREKRRKRKREVHKRKRECIAPGDQVEERPPSFSHAFKSDKPSSKRSKVFANLLTCDYTDSMEQWSNHHPGRASRKAKKIKEELTMTPVANECCFDRHFLQMNKVIFDGRPGLQAHPPKGCYPWSVVISCDRLRSDESVTGSRLVPDGQDVNAVYKLLPRKKVIEYDFENLPSNPTWDPTSVDKLRKNKIRANHKLIDAFNYCGTVLPGIERGVGKDVCFPDGKAGSKYCCAGKYPYRGGRGLLERDLRELSPLNGKCIGKLVCRLEQLMKEYIPTSVIAGLEKAKHVLGYEGMSVGKDGKRASTYSSIAFGKKVFLSCHLDDDSYYSLVTVECRVEDAPYGMKDPILVYFCFPEYGVKVGLRQGDVLLFNPRVMHCVSSAVDENTDYFCISMYMKTSVVSGHDNNVEVTKEQLAFL